jgi:hypothetical protein
MSVAGFCEICQQPDVEFTCDRCGNLVCEDHFDASVGYCVQCAAELGGGGGGDVDEDDLPDGVGTYRS